MQGVVKKIFALVYIICIFINIKASIVMAADNNLTYNKIQKEIENNVIMPKEKNDSKKEIEDNTIKDIIINNNERLIKKSEENILNENDEITKNYYDVNNCNNNIQNDSNEIKMKSNVGFANNLQQEKRINETEKYNIKYETHVQDVGWQEWKKDEEVAGTTGKSLRLEAIQIELHKNYNLNIKYQVHIQNVGWQDWKKMEKLQEQLGKN